VVQNIYLPTTNCSSFNQLGIKDCLSPVTSHIHAITLIHLTRLLRPPFVFVSRLSSLLSYIHVHVSFLFLSLFLSLTLLFFPLVLSSLFLSQFSAE